MSKQFCVRKLDSLLAPISCAEILASTNGELGSLLNFMTAVGSCGTWGYVMLYCYYSA